MVTLQELYEDALEKYLDKVNQAETSYWKFKKTKIN